MTYRIAYIPRIKQYGGLCEARAMSWRMGGRAVVGRRSAESVVRGGGRCSRFYLGVCGVKLVSVRACQQPGLIGVEGNGELILILHARLPSEGPKGSSGGMRGGVRYGDAASR